MPLFSFFSPPQDLTRSGRLSIISLTVVRCVQLGISHTQWTIVHHFSHSCEMRAVGVRDFHVSLFNHQLTETIVALKLWSRSLSCASLTRSGRLSIISLTAVRCVQLGIAHTQWTIVHHFSHSCEMRAVGVRGFQVPFHFRRN